MSKAITERNTDLSTRPDTQAGNNGQPATSLENARAELLCRTERLADELARRPNLGLKTAPTHEIERCAELGLLTAPLPVAAGGLGLGLEPGTHGTLLRVLAALGGADLPLGRLLEGHVNGLLLVARFGRPEQIARLAEDVRAGMLSGAWNTGRTEVLKLHPDGAGFRFEGGKTFATGAAFVQRPIVTAEIPGCGWQMTLPRMETLGATIDRSFWHPLGMENSESFAIDFTGGRLDPDDLIGEPGQFYLDPMFRGGAIRFAAVQAGALMRLHTHFADWLEEMRRGEDPYQIARLGETAIAAQTAALWVERAADVAEESFYRSEKLHAERMIACANMMRTAVERLAAETMRHVTVGVGARGLLQPAPFERLIRDLTMYLRQPAPDQALAAAGRYALERTRRLGGASTEAMWSDADAEESLPVRYFDRIYERAHDPWSFETSDYERRKYEATLAALPREHYGNAVEVGCSIGVLTRLLAPHADTMLGLDVSERALERARERNAELPHVGFDCRRVPHEWPDAEPFDLIVISEVAYYWTKQDLARAADGLAERHQPGGHLMLVHLTEWVPDYPQTGDAVHDYWLSRPEWRRVAGERHHRFRIDVLERNA